MPTERAQFGEKILQINPSYTNVFGTGLPGMSGTSVATAGANSSTTDIVNHLHRSTSQFLHQLSSQASLTDITLTAQTVEGDLLNLQLLGCLGKAHCNSLIDELHALVKQR